MKTKLQFLRWLMVLLLSVIALGAWAQSSQTLTQNVCVGTEPYMVDKPSGIAGSTYTWTVSGGGTITSGNGTNSINVDWTIPGGPYDLTVIRNDGNCDGPPQTVKVTVNPLPVITLTGASPVCLNSTGNVYTTETGMTNYVWTVVGGTVTAGGTPTSNTVTVTWDGTGPYSVAVNYNNANGCNATSAKVLPVTINPLPVITLTGTSPVCLNSTGNVYTTETGMTNYVWTVGGGTVTAGGTPTSNTVTVTWDGTGPYSVAVNYNNANGCNATSAKVLPVTINPLPVITLTGASPVCLNSTGNVYTTETGMTNYVWTVGGGTVTAGGTPTSNTVTVTWNGTGPYSVAVNYNNANGCNATSAKVLPVTINPLPVITLTGATPVCLNSTGNVYTTETGMTNYVWTVVGGTVTAGGTPTSNTVTVTWDGTGPYSVAVNYNNANGCNATSAKVLPVTINPLPVITLTGASPVCLNSTGNVYTTETGMTNYVWTVVGGTVTAGGTPTSNTVTVTWDGTGPYSVAVNYNNANGCNAASAKVLPVTINTLPATSPIWHN